MTFTQGFIVGLSVFPMIITALVIVIKVYDWFMGVGHDY